LTALDIIPAMDMVWKVFSEFIVPEQLFGQKVAEFFMAVNFCGR